MATVLEAQSPDSGAAPARSGPALVTFVVNYEIMMRPEVVSGTLQVQVAAGKDQAGRSVAALKLWQLRERFPFEGDFFFRAKYFPKSASAAPRHVWLDLVDEEVSVPRVKERLIEIKATPLFETEPALDSLARQSEFPLSPDEWDAARQARGAAQRAPLSSAELASWDSEDADGLAERASSGAAADRGAPGRGAAAASVAAGGAGSKRGSSQTAGMMFSLAKKAGLNVGAGFAGLLRRAGAAAAEIIEGGAPPTEAAAATMLGLQADLRTPFRTGEEEHEASLVALWSGLFHEAAPFERCGRAWVEAGCISEDPADTFAAGGPTRAAGLLGLHAAVHCASEHSEAMQDLLERHSSEDETSLRILSTVNALARELATRTGVSADNLGAMRAPFFRLMEEPEGFFELVFLALMVLDHVWTEAAATQARFSEVLDLALQRAAAWLATGPTSVDALRAAAQEADEIVLRI